MRAGRNTSEMKLTFTNGSTWQVAGSDNYDSLVGSSPAGVVFSEWSLAKPEAWSFIRPILAENGGWALFLWTPRGRGHATRAFESRRQRPDEWFTLKSPATETDVFSHEQLKREREELIAELGSEEGRAPYLGVPVDFDAATPEYARACWARPEQAGAGRGAHDPALKVDKPETWASATSGRLVLPAGGARVRAIDYYDRQRGCSWWCNAIANKPYVYGTHHLPPDVIGARARALAVSRPWRAGLADLGEVAMELGARSTQRGW
jgi:hypothetical protein